jgi:hypothetical protein
MHSHTAYQPPSHCEVVTVVQAAQLAITDADDDDAADDANNNNNWDQGAASAASIAEAASLVHLSPKDPTFVGPAPVRHSAQRQLSIQDCIPQAADLPPLDLQVMASWPPPTN